jgi:hypothetical protein
MTVAIKDAFVISIEPKNIFFRIPYGTNLNFS